MAIYNKFNQLPEDLANGVHNLASDQLVVALTNTAPTAGLETLSEITEITYTNLSSRNITTTSSTQTSGTYALVLQDLVLTASGGSVGPFQYVVIYNDAPTSPADPLIGYYDYGSAVTLADGETFTVDLTEAQTLFDIT